MLQLLELLMPCLRALLTALQLNRQSTAARRITYSEDLDMSSDYEVPLSKGKARKAQVVQRPRRHNSKPARFCEESQPEKESNGNDRPRRKHHNPWYVVLLD